MHVACLCPVGGCARADEMKSCTQVLPDRKPLVTSMGTLRSANLLPNVLLMLRCTDRQGSQQLTIRSELMLASQQRNS